MEMKFLGENIHITKNLQEYNSLRHLYERHAYSAGEQFKTLYFEKNNNIKDVLNNSRGHAEDIWIKAVGDAIKILISKDIYEINEDIFIECFYEELFGEFNSAYDYIYSAYTNILNEEERKDYERKLKKETRGRVRGGGFGLGGAIKGMAMAGAMNAASGAIHSAANSLGKTASSIGASKKTNNLYKDPNTVQSLTIALYHAVFLIHAGLVDLINKHSNEKTYFIIDYKSAERNKIILKNLLNHSDENSKLKEILIESITANPYDQEYYEIAIDKFGDPEKEIEKLAEFFFIDVSKYKDSLIREYYSSLNLSNELTTQKSKKLLEQKLSFLGVSNDNSEYREIIKIVKKFDLDYRTVDNICFGTREEADVAKEEQDFIHKLLQDANLEDVQIISDLIEEIDYKCRTQLSEEYIEELKSTLEEVILKNRTIQLTIGTYDCPIVYDTEGEAILAQQRIENLKNMIDNTDKSSEGKLIKLLEDVNNKKTEKESKYFIDYIEELLNKIDTDLKTANNKLYDTREEAAIVRNNLEQVESIDISDQVSEKHLDNIKKSFDSEDMHEDVKTLVKDKIYDAKIAKEDIREEKYNTIFGWIFIVIAVASCFFDYSMKSEFTSLEILGNELILGSYIEPESMELVDGVKNGLMALPRTFAESSILAFKDYIGGFGNGLVSSAIWLVVGMVWIPIKHILLFFPRYLVMLFIMLFQKSSLLYYVGYVGTTLLTFKIIQLTEFKRKKIER